MERKEEHLAELNATWDERARVGFGGAENLNITFEWSRYVQYYPFMSCNIPVTSLFLHVLGDAKVEADSVVLTAVSCIYCTAY